MFCKRDASPPKRKPVSGRKPEFWFAPAPGAAWPEDRDAFLRGLPISAVMFYQPQVWGPSIPYPAWVGNNKREEIQEVSRIAKIHAIQVYLEVNSLKAWNAADPVSATTAAAMNHGELLNAAGVVADEGNFAGLKVCALPEHVVADFMNYFVTISKAVVIEPYPALSKDELLRAIDRTAQSGGAGFHLDLDWNAIRRSWNKGHAEVLLALQASCQSQGLPFGLVVWGWDERDSWNWVKSARELFDFYTNVFQGREWPNRLIVQSWSPMVEDRPRSMPTCEGLGALCRELYDVFAV